ncbi:hypothetical protein [Ruania halotolerans]|uniref:hypothetical protein n=1 Tax=Ruania halotolerans TaxID=2897773 RepID=UPI001E400717|nr:hypothetical protein [Ruania halotolerans]UFU05499.1 hypothetical protein LQF10_13725 [Ruania halotolerans]
MNLKQQLAATIKAATDILDGAKSANRDLTHAEKAELDGHLAKGKELKANIEAAERSAALVQAISGRGDGGAKAGHLSATDALGLETNRNASGAFDLGGAIDPAASTVCGTRYVVVPGLATGDGYVVGADSVQLSTDGAGVRAEWGTSGDKFTRNQLVARVEGRFNLDVTKAHDAVRMALSGA